MSEAFLPFTGPQIKQLSLAFHRGAAEASSALSKWLSVTTTICIDSVDQCPLENATSVLGEGDTVACMCLMQMQGTLTGQMLLAFDDASGLSITDLLLSRPSGTATEWGEVEISAALETMNIVGSAYLNGIAEDLSGNSDETEELIPTPPTFFRDFVESLLETAFLDQAVAGSQIVFARARFEREGNPLHWSFLLIPDPASLNRLSQILKQLP